MDDNITFFFRSKCKLFQVVLARYLFYIGHGNHIRSTHHLNHDHPCEIPKLLLFQKNLTFYMHGGIYIDSSVGSAKQIEKKKKSSLGGLVIFLSSFLCLFFCVALIFRILHKIWWTPNHIQKVMASQGIRCPPYRLIHGNTKEISNMHKEAMSRPLSLSHDICAYVHSWSNKYGI